MMEKSELLLEEKLRAIWMMKNGRHPFGGIAVRRALDLKLPVILYH